MTNWTPARSILLSQLLGDVVGTEEMVRIRQEYCRIWDFLVSAGKNINTYFTGSKAEGLYLPGSDKDYMGDINKAHNMKVIQSELDTPCAADRNMFVMYTENVRPCFAMLRSVRPIRNRNLFNACQEIESLLYHSSYLYVHDVVVEFSEYSPHIATTTQGPSIEVWNPYMDRSKSGSDKVFSIHGSFWPDAAREWRSRLRRYAWPASRDMKTVVDFGFHYVPIGHPHSHMNMMEWRMSFSVAERTLARSFNHVQMPCYAVMKLILKEFANPYFSPPCRVLCSYFIKTFLFWEYEKRDPSYWRKENFKECGMRVLSDFCKCIRMRSLRRYFIPSFNLLSGKMTDQAQMELLRIFDIILQSDISIIKECKTLNKVMAKFLHLDIDAINVAYTVKRNLLRNDVCMMETIRNLQYHVLKLRNYHCVDVFTLISQFINHFHMLHTVHKTHLPSFAMRILLYYKFISLSFRYRLHKTKFSIHHVGFCSQTYLDSTSPRVDCGTQCL